MRIVNLNTKNTTYQIGIDEGGSLFHYYYGPSATGDMSNLVTAHFRGGHGVLYDHKEDRTWSNDFFPQEYSCMGNGDYRDHAFRMRTSNGAAGCDLRVTRVDSHPGKYTIPGLPASYGEDAETTEIELTDARVGLTVVLKYAAFYEADIITRSVAVTNAGSADIYLNKVMSAAFDFNTGDFDLLHFYGRHFNEMNMERTHVGTESVSIGSRRGVSGHQHNPFAVLCSRDAGEEHGSCYGIGLMWSGNFVISAERDQYGQVRLQAGVSDELFDYRLTPGETFYAPEAVLTYSDHGFTTLSHNLHRFIRNNVCRGKYKNCRRPILVNNWEATYFDFTGEKLVEISQVAKDLGIEMFVLDDGWFGNRGPDDRGLGDWTVNEAKLGGKLSDVVDRINALGLKFGLWFEPEMISENSELYREHPDYALTIPGKPPVIGRLQLVLDFTRKDIRDNIFDQMCRVIDSAHIEYIKVDMNRSISEAYSALADYQNFGELTYRYMLGVYELLDRIIKRYPDLLIEGCSSGGARFDMGLMYYTPQIWTSDNSDAIERLWIQYGASFGYPVSVVGSHVSAVPNHQNGRVTDINTRGVVAMSGNFGYELDLTKLSTDDRAAIRTQISTFKEDWELIHNGYYYRGVSPYDGKDFVSWNMVNDDHSLALVNAVTTNTHGNPTINYVPVRGLSDDLEYTCVENSKTYCGSVLRTIGFPLPCDPGEYNAYQYHFKVK